MFPPVFQEQGYFLLYGKASGHGGVPEHPAPPSACGLKTLHHFQPLPLQILPQVADVGGLARAVNAFKDDQPPLSLSGKTHGSKV